MYFHYSIFAELAEQHRRDLLREAHAARLIREARASATGPRVRRARVITLPFRRQAAPAV
jgi:hypothetical protein